VRLEGLGQLKKSALWAYKYGDMKSRKMLLMSRVTLTVNHHLADTTAF
jgi:hypothetical protein